MDSLSYFFQAALSQAVSPAIDVLGSRRVHGGCINDAHVVDSSEGSFFVKSHQNPALATMFQKEVTGLRRLQETAAVKVPHILGQGYAEGRWFLILAWVESKEPTVSYWSQLGRQLANLHRCTESEFGWEESNFIGSLAQSNNRHVSWPEFFVEERLTPQVQLLGSDTGRWSKRLKALYKLTEDLCPAEKPALLHGDLWSGNVVVGSEGEPILIDPAVYFGHREMELAFTTLFGGFHTSFYDAYQEAYPLADGYSERRDLYNLYPLLVHANLFGGGYYNQVKVVLRSLGIY